MKKNNLPLNYQEKNNSRISFLVSIISLLMLLFFFNQLDYNLIGKPEKENARKAAQEKEAAEKAASTPVVSAASIIAVGDNLYHDNVVDSGRTDSGDWNYDHIYTHVLDEIQAADVAMVDQETILTKDHNAVSGYPSFATPTEAGDALVKAGFDVIESATNHADDYGYGYIQDTLDFWSTNYPDVALLGLHGSQEDADDVRTLEVNGITLAFLNYVYGTNNPSTEGIPDYAIDLFDQARISAAIQKAKSVSDCVIFVAQWGKEMESMPTEYEKQWANFLMKQGVDVIIGGHPHVLQPYGWLSDDAGNETLIFYSLGNFVSHQESLDTLLGGMASFTVEKTELKGESAIKIIAPEVKPLVMHYDYETGEYGPYMLEDYTDELARSHSVKNYIGDGFTLANLQARFNEIMSMNVTPSTGTSLLDVSFDYELNMTDASGNYVEDTWSVTESQYRENLANGSSSQESGDASGNNSDDSGDYDDSDDYDDSSDYDEEY